MEVNSIKTYITLFNRAIQILASPSLRSLPIFYINVMALSLNAAMVVLKYFYDVPAQVLGHPPFRK